MKKISVAFFMLLCLSANAQDIYWQQELVYKIDVELNDVDKTLKAFETIVYKNNSPSTLNFIWFHIWPNAYSNQSTALFKQIKHDPDRREKLNKVTMGNISGLAFKINNIAATTEPHPEHIDIIKLLLNEPLKPGDSISISTPFIVKLPSYFSRSGFGDGEIMACQWYPKPAVFDKDGWHEFPYLDMGEFYSEYANFTVNLTLPSEYIVGATGEMQTSNELDIYKTIGRKNYANKDSKPEMYIAADPKALKTLTWAASNVPDFAFFADKNFTIHYDTAKLTSGKIVDAFTFYHYSKKSNWSKSIDFVKDGLRHYSDWIGDYAYPVVQAVEGPKNNASGGMEYPMITLITNPNASDESLDGVITHEVGHNWFMSILGSNERMHTWMDEGLNTYYQFRYEAEKYRSNSIYGKSLPSDMSALPAATFLDLIYKNLYEIPMQMPIETPAADFRKSNDYGIVSYVKTALWMYMLEVSLGREKVDRAVKNYYAKWKFKHPQPSDMKASFEEAVEAKLDDFFDLLNKRGKL